MLGSPALFDSSYKIAPVSVHIIDYTSTLKIGVAVHRKLLKGDSGVPNN